MVSFEWLDNGVLTSDYFPDKTIGEELISTKVEAWFLATEFAKATKGLAYNVFVIDHEFSPVSDVKAKMLNLSR